MTTRKWLSIHLLISCFAIACGEYLGCFRDTEQGLMRGYQENFVLTLTPDQCVNLCTSKGFHYAGLKSRISCLCDQQSPHRKNRTEENKCQAGCVGDNTKKCGGEETISIYSTRLAQREAEESEELPKGFVGCYKDDNNDRLLSGHVQELTKNSPEKCKSLCHQMGFLYSGVEFGVECFCGDAHPPAGLLRDKSLCSMACHGSSDTKCGGSGHIAVYDTGITDIPELGMKLNCFNDEDPRVLLGYKIDLEKTNSPRRCMNLCRSLNYQYSGVEYGMECFCGNTIFANISRDSADEECNTTCPGDEFESCGGHWEILVYRTGLSDPDPVAKKLGCFPTDGAPISAGYRQDITQPSSLEKCTKLCYNKGFFYNALISSTECWCLADKPQSLLIGNEECKESHAALYETGYTIPRPEQKENYVGCFKDSSERVLSGFYQKFERTLTPEKCSKICFNKGHLYSGTKNRNECHCRDKRPKGTVADTECSSPCSGDISKHCGGNRRLSVFATGISDVPTTGKLIGCFVDDTRPRVLDKHKTDLEKTNSPRRCLNYCLNLGFKFAGLQYQKECFCGNTKPSASLDAPDSQCDSVCSGDSYQTCGGGWRMAVYRTDFNNNNLDSAVLGTTPKPHNGCKLSETRINGKQVCQGTVVFKDTFSGSSIARHWQHVVKIADAPDYEFVTFTLDAKNSFQKDGKLTIKPTMISDTEVQHGSNTLDGCTGLAATRECELTAFSYNILPPIHSARLHTRNNFSFRYGVVEIRARLPAGDWLVPELWLLPKDQSYGNNYLSGKVRIAMSRGNRYLTYKGEDIGSSRLESGILVGSESNVSSRSIINRIADSWHTHAHNYTLVWTSDNLSFYVDGQFQQALLPPGVRLTQLLGFTERDVSAWNTGSTIAPFDTDFYLSLGVSAGGSRDFPDGCISKNQEKPWANFKLKAMLNFWLNKNSWLPSWDDNKSSLVVEHVLVTAL